MLRWTDEQLAEYAKRLGRQVKQVKESPKKSKYGNVKTQVDGRTFDSRAEARRYQELRAMEDAGLITELICQPRFPLVVEGKFGTWKRDYIGDFAYRDGAGNMVCEDVKGVATREYQFKKGLLAVLHGIEIQEIRRGKKVERNGKGNGRRQNRGS